MTFENLEGGVFEDIVETTVKTVIDKRQVIESITSSETSIGAKIAAEAKAGGVFKLVDISASTTAEMNHHLEFYIELK